MKPSEVLYDLINSLSKGEKRNFKLLAQLGSGDKAYLKLFDLIDRQNGYDEAKLVKQYKKIQPKGQFSVAKNYLYKSIIKSLLYFDKSEYSDQSSLILEIRTLMSKRLYKHAHKQLRKARDAANEREGFDELLLLLELEEDILKQLEKIREYSESVRRIEFEQRVLMEKIQNLQVYRHLENEIYLLKKNREVARNENEESQIDKILNHPLMADPYQALSVRAKIKYHEILRKIYFYQDDHHRCVNHSQKVVDLYNLHPVLKNSHLLRYIYALSALSVHLFKVEDLDRAFRIMRDLKHVNLKTPEARMLIFERYYLSMMAYQLDMGVDENGLRLYKQVEAELKYIESGLHENTRLLLYFINAYFFMQVRDFRKALQWINKFLNLPKTNLRDDMQCMARLVNLLIHYELGNYELVEYSLKSAYRFIFKRNRMNQFEKITLRYLKKLIHSPEGDRPDLFREFRNKLEEAFEADVYEARSQALFDMLSWIDSNLKGTTMSELKREKTQDTELVKAFHI